MPFHFYAPDVYQGAPTIVAALLAWVPKGIGFVAMLRALSAVVSVGSDLLSDRAILLAWVIALATMVLGNTVALVQENLKRLLAYSSIAHAGYLMVGVAASFAHVAEPNAPGPNTGGEGILFYLVSYALMTLGAFGVILFLNRGDERVETIDDLSGLGQTPAAPRLRDGPPAVQPGRRPAVRRVLGQVLHLRRGLERRPGDARPRLPVAQAAGGPRRHQRGGRRLLLPADRRHDVLRRPEAGRRASTAREPGGWPTGLAVGACAVLSLVVGLFPGPVLRASRSAAVAALAQPDPRPIGRTRPRTSWTSRPSCSTTDGHGSGGPRSRRSRASPPSPQPIRDRSRLLRSRTARDQSLRVDSSERPIRRAISS